MGHELLMGYKVCKLLKSTPVSLKWGLWITKMILLSSVHVRICICMSFAEFAELGETVVEAFAP